MAHAQAQLTDATFQDGSRGEEDLPPVPARVDDPTEEQKRMLADRAREFARSVLSGHEYEDAVDVDEIDWWVSTNLQRTRKAADASAKRTEDMEITDREISLTWQAFVSWGWEAEFAGAIRHELAHHVDYSKRKKSGHDMVFEMRAEKLGAALEAPQFYDDHRLRVYCGDGCEDYRNKASSFVKSPRKGTKGRAEGQTRRCRNHGNTFTVEHVATGRTWETADGYERERAAIEAAPDESW